MGLLSELAIAADPALILEAAGMQPDPWQASILRSRPRQLLLNITRQGGKSTTVSAMAIDEALGGISERIAHRGIAGRR